MNWLLAVGSWCLEHWQVYFGFGVIYTAWLTICRWRIENTLRFVYGGDGIFPHCHWFFRAFFPLPFILAEGAEDDFSFWTLFWGKTNGWRRKLAGPVTVVSAPIQFLFFIVFWIVLFLVWIIISCGLVGAGLVSPGE